MSAAARNLACPRCSGVLEDAGETATSECPYCGVAVLVQLEDQPRRLYAPPRLGPEEADAALRRCLAGSPAPLGYPDGAPRAAHRLLFLPFHQLRGTYFLRLEHGRGGAGEDTEVDLRPLYLLEPALLDDRFGMQSLGTTQDSPRLREELRPFDPDAVEALGAVFPPDYGPEKLERSIERSLEDTHRRRGLARHMVERDPALVFLPVWEARYWWEDRVHTAYVDAREGRVLGGRAPEGHRARNFLAHLLLFGIAGGLLGVGRSLTEAQRIGREAASNLVAVDVLLEEAAALALALVAAALLVGLFRRYRRPPVVRLRDDTFHQPGAHAGLLDTVVDLLELAVRVPVAMIRERAGR